MIATEALNPSRLALVACAIAIGALACSSAAKGSGTATIEPPPSAPPSIESESVSSVTEHDATLEAQIDPNGHYTAYEFQIDTNGRYNYPKDCCPLDVPGYVSCDCLVDGEPLPEGLVEPQPADIVAGFDAVSVSVDLGSIGANLTPATTYHFLVIASNGDYAAGPDEMFATPGSSLKNGNGQGTPPTRTSPPPQEPIKATASTEAQKRARTLRECEKKPKKRRASCRRRSRRRHA